MKKYIPITIISSIISVIGVALWIVALRVAGPPMTSFLMKFQVVFSVILGVLFLNERLKRPEILGIFLTFVGGLVITYKKLIDSLITLAIKRYKAESKLKTNIF